MRVRRYQCTQVIFVRYFLYYQWCLMIREVIEELHLLYSGSLEDMSNTENFYCLSHHLLSKSRRRSLKPNQEYVLFGNYI